MIEIPNVIKVLIVEDSDLQCALLLHILGSVKSIRVIGLAKNGLEAINTLNNIKPDIILMDLHMPVMNGIDAIKHIMSNHTIPIIAMSASTGIDELVNGFIAMELGATAFTEKPGSIYDPRYDFLCSNLISTIKLMSEVKVIRRQHISKTNSSSIQQTLTNNIQPVNRDIQLIAIGVSTGGPVVLQTILSHLETDFPPIIIAQHIIPGFIDGLVQWLTLSTHTNIQLAENNQTLRRGHVYFAPDNYHVGINSNGKISLHKANSEHQHCPSIDFLFNSVAEVLKKNAMGILLTGMGSDGAKQLKHLRDEGAITIAQNKESSLIYGMPAQAVALDAATYILAPEEIAAAISSLPRSLA